MHGLGQSYQREYGVMLNGLDDVVNIARNPVSESGDARMHKGIFRKFLEEAEAEVASIDVETLAARMNDPEITVIDIRDIREVQREGMIPRAHHAPRGMLEFWIDEESPYHKPYFAEDKTFVFYCAGGWRSLLAAQTAQSMGLRAMSLHGGFKAWKEKNYPVKTDS